MKRLEAIVIDDEAIRLVSEVMQSKSDILADLLRAGGLDPAHDLRGATLSGWPLGGQDLRGFDLTDADLRRTGVHKAVFDETTIFAGAKFDALMRKKLSGGSSNKKPRRPRPLPPADGYTLIKLPSLSDEEMLAHKFVIQDPTEIEDVADGIPPTDQYLTYEGRYEASQDLSCAFAHRHRKGYVFRDEEGRRYRIGHNCGAKHFNLGQWRTFTRDRAQLEDRAGYLRFVRDLDSDFRKHRDWIASLPNSAPVIAYDGLKLELRRSMKPLVDECRRVLSREQGNLLVEHRERDFEAEQRELDKALGDQQQYDRKEKVEQENLLKAGIKRPIVKTPPRYKIAVRNLGLLQGASLFEDTQPLNRRSIDLLRLVDAFLNRPQSNFDKASLIAISRNAQVLVDRLRNFSFELNEAISFFSPNHIPLVAGWADHHRIGGARYSPIAEGIIVTPDQKKPFFFKKPRGLVPLESRPMTDLVHFGADRMRAVATRRTNSTRRQKSRNR